MLTAETPLPMLWTTANLSLGNLAKGLESGPVYTLSVGDYNDAYDNDKLKALLPHKHIVGGAFSGLINDHRVMASIRNSTISLSNKSTGPAFFEMKKQYE